MKCKYNRKYFLSIFLVLIATPALAVDTSMYDSLRIYHQHKAQQKANQIIVPETEVLDYRFSFGSKGNPLHGYMSSKIHQREIHLHQLRRNTAISATSSVGPFPYGEALFVRWRDNSTGKIYEDQVDLKKLLSEENKVFLSFSVDGPKLSVYQLDGPLAFPGTKIYPEHSNE